MGSIGGWEIILIFLVVLLVFGAKRIPEIARGLGKGIREFKDATSDIKRELSVEDDRSRIQPPRQAPRAQQEYQQQPQAAPSPEPARAEDSGNPDTEPRD
jgi:sec-independent protein translocase protein TatA